VISIYGIGIGNGKDLTASLWVPRESSSSSSVGSRLGGVGIGN